MTEDKKLGNIRNNNITVNGISLMEYMKSKKTTSTKKTPQGKTTPGNRKKEKGTLTPSARNIKNYFKQRDISDKKSDKMISHNNTQYNDISEDNVNKDNIRKNSETTNDRNSPEDITPPKMKMTFDKFSAPPPRIKKKIDRFQDLHDGDKCVMGSGRCATHHVKLVKRVIERRVSVVDKCGQVSWAMREGTIFDCPKSRQSGRCEDSPAVTNLPVGKIVTNKKRKLIQKEGNDQLDES